MSDNAKQNYITLGWYDADAKDYLSKTVYETEIKSVKTGLLNKDGTPLYRVDQPNPIGFVPFTRR